MDIKDIKALDIKEICTRQELGSLNFSDSVSSLEKIRDVLLEILESPNYDSLTSSEQNSIQQRKREFENYITQITNFSLTNGSSNPTDQRNNIQAGIRNFYNSFIQETRTIFNFISQQSLLAVTKSKEFRDSIKDIQKLRNDFIHERKSLEDTIVKLQSEKEKVQATKGQISTTFLSQEFQNQYESHKNSALKWHFTLRVFYILLLSIVGYNLYKYFELRNTGIATYSFFNYEYGILMIGLVSMVFYGLNFCSSNYKVTKNLETINRHRRNVAETFGKFLETSPDDTETKNKLLQEASVAMFQYIGSGYLTKDTGVSTPTLEMINKISPISKAE